MEMDYDNNGKMVCFYYLHYKDGELYPRVDGADFSTREHAKFLDDWYLSLVKDAAQTEFGYDASEINHYTDLPEEMRSECRDIANEKFSYWDKEVLTNADYKEVVETLCSELNGYIAEQELDEVSL